ncbi:MAG: lipid-A-disaccharide synthase [Luminiphilus sp.]|nr:lipid-A-disaccharide synthase [Luminiphilus sp.]MDG1460942.1 lipid-A-disaccharide synthase [Luminiphilus sp.]
MRLGILAGEASGDILGASVARELRRRHSHLQLQGIGGDRLAEQGLASLHPMDRLSVFGIVDPLKRLPELLKIRRQAFQQQLSWRPDCFVGIDSPDFNLTLESQLRARGLTTAHLVSPSVWAWRPGRVQKIATAVDLMLCLLPFETGFYEAAGVPAVCVGHPLIEELKELPPRAVLRGKFGLPDNAKVLAVLPGSRAGEVASLMAIYSQTMANLASRHRNIHFLIPAANDDRRRQIEAVTKSLELSVTVISGQGREAMLASDAVLLASGTATLEAMLLRRPMVVAYRMPWLSWQILSRMAITRFVGLPNVLANREVVPELLQEAATPDQLTRQVEYVLERGMEQQIPVFDELAAQIGGGFSARTADALDSLMDLKRG